MTAAGGRAGQETADVPQVERALWANAACRGQRRRAFQIRVNHVTGMLLARHRLRLRLTSTARFSMPTDRYDVSSWTSTRVRTEFFNFFRSKDHSFVPSSSTIPYEDPTLLFANAGMNQVRPLFRNLPTLYNSLASSNLFSSPMSILTPNCQS